MKKILITSIAIISLCCESNSNISAKEIWNTGKEFRSEKKIMKSITSFKSIIKKYPNDDLAPEAQFQIADIYLNDSKNYKLAIDEFINVINHYPNHEVSKKSLFMIAYINNNYLQAQSDAIIYYNKFKEKYPDDQLIQSVDYELNDLMIMQNSIDSLKNKIQ